MISALLACLVSATAVGACADRSACRFTVGDDAPLKAALASLELTAGELKAPPLKRPGGDLAFSLSSQVKGDAVVVKAVSLQRPASTWGEGSGHLIRVKKPEWKQRALQSGLKVAIAAALEDLKARIEGVRKLTLSVRTSGLDGQARSHAETALLPCLKGLFELVGAVSTAEQKGPYLDESIEYLPEKDEPREPLDWQVGRVREALLGGVRSKCSVFGTPLQGWSTLITADALNRAVVISFRR